MTTMQTCTCSTPPIIDITSCYLGALKNEEISDHQRLKENLELYGWSILEIDTSSLAHDPISNDGLFDLLMNHNNWKIRISRMFDPELTSSVRTGLHAGGTISYRHAESGAPGQSIEPKESWEIKRQKLPAVAPEPYIEKELSKFVQILHQIATTVRRSMGLPANVLLQEEIGGENIDLMRAFYYHRVKGEELTLGSSPHSDWGSFTVVWQDDVGGLETYCKACRKWNSVPSSLVSTWKLRFVVHLSDLSSIALALASQQVVSDTAPSSSDLETTLSQRWPSPVHRVISPTNQERTSLVYFAYPPPHDSLKRISEKLTGWVSDNVKPTGVQIALNLSDYYLLRDQRQSSPTTIDCNTLLREALPTDDPIALVIDAKWKQVQR